MTDAVVVVRPHVVTTVVRPTAQTVKVTGLGARGPAGPQGPEGPAGVSAEPLDVNVAVASEEWVVEHNLGHAPAAVTTYGTDGKEIVGGRIVENTAVRTVITWAIPVAGRLTLL